MTTYTKSLSADFGSNLNIEQFNDEIINSSIVPALQGVTLVADVVDITFASALSAGEVTTLDGLISSHVIDIYIYYTDSIDMPLKTGKFKYKSYGRVSTVIFKGTRNMIGTLSRVLVIAYKHKKATDYSLRLYDRTNSKVIAEDTFTNNEEAILQLIPTDTLSLGESQLELQVKKSGSKEVLIGSAILQFS